MQLEHPAFTAAISTLALLAATPHLLAGPTVTLHDNNIPSLNTFDPTTNFILPIDTPFFSSSSWYQYTESAGFNLNGGSITFSSTHDNRLLDGNLTLGDSTLNIGPAGATFFDPAIQTNTSVEAPINAQGPVILQPAANAWFIFQNTLNTLSTLNVNGNFAATSPGAVHGASINIASGQLILLGEPYSGIAFPPVPTLNYPNTLSFTGNTTLSSQISISNASNLFSFLKLPNYPSSTFGFVRVGTVNLGQGNLTLQLIDTIATLNLTGNATLLGSVAIGNISDDGSPHALTIAGGTSGGSATPLVSVSGTISTASPITVSQQNIEIDGPVTRSTAPLTIAAQATLAGTANIQRPVSLGFISSSQSFLSPGAYGSQHPGTLTVDSLTLGSNSVLKWDLSSPNHPGNDLLVDNGDLALDGTLSLSSPPFPGTYTLITYAGTLTNNGLFLPVSTADTFALDLSTPGQVNLIVTAAPEPLSLALLSPLALLLRRRR